MKLSIITINYNNRDGLQKTIDSVICQTWRDFEWIVIDGGSTDGSRELIEMYQDHFAYWCSEPDKGVYNAMNKGIAKAKGEYINFMNSGDCFVSKTILQEVFSYGYDEDIISGQTIRGDDYRLIRKFDENIVRQLIQNTIDHQSAFIKKKLFDAYLYKEDYKIVSDWIAWIEWLLKSDCSLRRIMVVVSIQDMSGISNMSSLSKKHEVERNTALRLILGERVSEELLRLYRMENKLKGELEIPAVKMTRYLYYNAPRWFSVIYRILILVVKTKDFFSKKTLYKSFCTE